MASPKKEHFDGSNGENGVDYAVVYPGDENAVHKSDFTTGNSVYAKLQRLAGKFGVEQRGIERVPSDERTDTSMTQVGTLVGRTPSTIPARI